MDNFKRILIRYLLGSAAAALTLSVMVFSAFAFIPGLYEWGGGDPKLNFAAAAASAIAYFTLWLGAVAALDVARQQLRKQEGADTAAVADPAAIR